MTTRQKENQISEASVESTLTFTLRNKARETRKELEKFETSLNNIKIKYIQEPGRMVNKINLCTDLITLNDQLNEILRYFPDLSIISGTIPQPKGEK